MDHHRRFSIQLRIAAALSCFALLTPSRAAAGAQLQLFKNYFVTGDYAAAGIGLRGKGVANPGAQALIGGANTFYATGTIKMTGVASQADIVAAFLYWQTMEFSNAPSAAGALFRGTK